MKEKQFTPAEIVEKVINYILNNNQVSCSEFNAGVDPYKIKVLKLEIKTMKTLKEFLEKNHACRDGFDFAKDLTLEQFLSTCHRGDWILWLFARVNPKSFRELTLAKGHCANTVRHLMKDERSTRAVDVAIAFGEGEATREELNAAYYAAYAASAYAAAYAAAYYAAYAAYAAAYNATFAVLVEDSDAAAYAASSAYAAYAAYAASSAYADYAAARKQNQKLTADICRQYLPLEIWNQNLI